MFLFQFQMLFVNSHVISAIPLTPAIAIIMADSSQSESESEVDRMWEAYIFPNKGMYNVSRIYHFIQKL